jgi:putative ABC transport system permease protein
MFNWWRDVRFGLRMLARNKGFTGVAILALALGIGPNVAIFSIIWATFLAPLPYPQANRIVVIWSHYKGQREPTSAADFAQYEAQSKSFQVMQFGAWGPIHITNPDGSEAPDSGNVGSTGNLLEVPMALGRYFQSEDGAPGKNHVVVIKHKLWVDRYHSDPNIIGKSILIDSQPYTIIGVYSAEPMDRICCSMFNVPMQFLPGVKYPYYGQVGARLKPGVTVAQAQAEIVTIASRIAAARPGGNDQHQWTMTVEPLKDDFLAPGLVRNLWLLLAAVGLVLLIACANVANLLLARGASRQQELAVRFALGASRFQVFAQFLAESLALAFLGGVAGIGIGWAIMQGALAIVPKLTSDNVVSLNLPVLAFACAAALLSGVFFGCAPAWHAARLNLSETLKQGSRSVVGSSRSRTQAVLVITEVALALTLLAGAGMTMHSFWNLTSIDLGVRTDHILTAFLDPRSAAQRGPGASFPAAPQLAVQLHQILQKLQTIPGVEDAALSTNTPLEGHDSFPFTIAGRPTPADNDKPVADLVAVTPGFFQTFGVHLLRGREFGDGDTLSTQPVAMVSESFVRRYLPGIDPLSQQVMIPFIVANQRPGTPVPHQIVGVFGDIANGQNLSDKDMPSIYISFFQNPLPFAAVALRTAVPPDTLTADLRSATAQVAPTLSLNEIQSMDEIVSTQLRGDRFSMVLLGGFAFLALLLSALGIYGVMAFAVAQRTHEIGIRMALGAQKSQVVALIVRGGMKLALVGAGLGLIGVYVLGRLMRSNLYDVGSVDYLSFAIVAVLLLAVAWFASWLPARRSARVDPMIALREE